MNDDELMSIQRELTMDGSIPDGYAFIADGGLYVWSPQSHLSLLIIESNELANKCRRYLQEKKMVYHTLDEAIEVIKREKWQNWEKLLYVDDQ